ncbi:hypothetical protein QCA50_013293 [Cerrena zonata]|uniref:C2H2-type domain-containing protein n=1 Tax=Cerrena zonata TaxID=2478898 RepID=A0AAW0FQ92_9APHY
MSHCASNTHLEVARAQATILFCTQCGPGTNFTDTKALEKHKGREHKYPCSKCNLGFPILRLRFPRRRRARGTRK